METDLSINKAARLYDILGKYIPDYLAEDDLLDFISSIVNNLKDGDRPQDYFDAIQLMTDVSLNVLESSEPIDVLELFVNGLKEWRIIELVQFFKYELGRIH